MSTTKYDPLEPNVQVPVYLPVWAAVGGYGAQLKLWCLASYRNPRSKKYINSIAALSRERKRQCQHWQRWIIHPFSAFRFIWETIMIFIYAISFIIIPFMTTFIVFDYEIVRLDKISLFLYIFFWLDIIINCITGFYNKNERLVNFNQSDILTYYFQRFLIVDILTSLPYDHITYPWRKVPGPDCSLWIACINLIPILKISRYIKFQSYVSQLFAVRKIKDFTNRMTNTLILSFYIIFWFACLCYLTPIMIMQATGKTIDECSCWLIKIKNMGIAERFQYAIFIVMQNFVASGYGTMNIEFTGHILICTTLVILGRIFEAYIIIMFLQIQADKKAAESEYLEIMNQIVAYTRQKQMPPYMQKRLTTYYNYRFRKNYFQEKKVLSSLSDKLREEIVLHSCHRLVESVLLFRNIPHDIIASIVSNLRMELYLPNELIVKAGSQGDCMFFLGAGSVAVFTPTGKEICHLDKGSHFGEVALLVQDHRRVATVVAIEVCEVYRLDRPDFRRCVAIHKDIFSKIERIATKRMEKTILIEEQYKRIPLNKRIYRK
ncbi:hypothetical protein PV327_000468 [Microctonus hyperodae]|uniref:Cyclic nucleotide-binding domain-containing protein n=1 Tax=Microctonus hyperodae TaxID=165561 RepID=A0AA39G6B5_MICHY|nr:hypothetical protein PV327_000468 [Microctonus hyperodae]